jgi:hypothetical protein
MQQSITNRKRPFSSMPTHGPRSQPCLTVPRNASIVDVVVDPQLSSLLRPHQRDGIKVRLEPGRFVVKVAEPHIRPCSSCTNVLWE